MTKKDEVLEGGIPGVLRVSVDEQKSGYTQLTHVQVTVNNGQNEKGNAQCNSDHLVKHEEDNMDLEAAEAVSESISQAACYMG